MQVTKGQHERAFFSLPEFEEETDNAHTWKVKCYRGQRKREEWDEGEGRVG